jgi:hypothetical protein
MCAGVHVAVAFLLSEISTLLEIGDEKEICLQRNWIRKRDQFGASGMPTIMKQLASSDTEFHKNHKCQTTAVLALRLTFQIISSRTIFIIVFSSWLYTVLIILIFLRTQSAVNPFSVDFLK